MGRVRDIVVPCPALGQGFWEKPVQKTQGLTAKKQVLVCRVRRRGETMEGVGRVSWWATWCVCGFWAMGFSFWDWFVVMGTGQQKSEEGEIKQEREEQRPTDSGRKKRSGPEGSFRPH